MNFSSRPPSDGLRAIPGPDFQAKALVPRSIEIIYMDAGGGHSSAAIALRDVIHQYYPAWNVQLANLFRDILRPLDPVYRVTGVHNGEDIYNRMLKQNWTYGFSAGMRGLQKLIKLSEPRIEKLLRQHWQNKPRPDLVVSVIPHFNAALFRALKQIHPETPYVTIMTDIADCPPHMWQEKQDQFLICGSERAVYQAKAAGYPDDRVFQTSGMILKPSFYNFTASPNRRAEQEKPHLDPDLPTALIMFGGYGAKVAEKIVDRLGKSGLDVQSIVMCGRNEELRQRLANRKLCHPVGFTPDGVPYYMSLSDFFIGKPGPGSISEALHMGLPVIVERNRRTMPQERYNAEWIREKDVGVVIQNFANIASTVQYLLDENHLDTFQKNARLMNNRAVYEIPLMFENIMAGNASDAITNTLELRSHAI